MPTNTKNLSGADNVPSLDNLIVLNSLSKRSNAAGLRGGFLAGDAAAIALYKKMVANAAALMPTPLLRASAALYRDASHADAVRKHYEASFAIAKKHLPMIGDEADFGGGFFLWLPVADDVAFARRAYQEQALRLMPGRFMAVDTDECNPGKGFVRVALVHDHDTIEVAMRRLAILFKDER
jgi:N-succinyldiaminopimelate aminotransferase